jgi:hypothetical protein
MLLSYKSVVHQCPEESWGAQELQHSKDSDPFFIQNRCPGTSREELQDNTYQPPGVMNNFHKLYYCIKRALCSTHLMFLILLKLLKSPEAFSV